MAEFASNAKANAGLTTGIIGTSLAGLMALGNGVGNVFGGNTTACGCSENHLVNRYELGQEQEIAKLKADIALRDANIYNDQKSLELYKYFDGEIKRIDRTLCEQAVFNATQTGAISCIQGQIAALQSLTKTIIPITNVCPQPMPQYNSWTAPTATTGA